jgi:hypothetical protein
MRVIKHGKLYHSDYLKPQDKWYALCPECERRVHTLTKSRQVLICRCKCEFECDENDLIENPDKRWFPIGTEPRQTAD